MRTSDSESEILLGNRQLLGIFFVIALLLAVAFYGGYKVGRGGSAHRVPSVATAPEETSTAPASSGGETHTVGAGDQASTASEASRAAAGTKDAEEPLGSPKPRTSARTKAPASEAAGAVAGESFAPQVGEQFLQVAAVGREEAQDVADVLHKKGFRAHAVPKPGNAKLYRVIIGPIHDTADLSSTREALVRAGFREVILQRY